MKQLIFSLMISTLILSTQVSCEKEDTPTTPSLTKTEKLAAHTWYVDEAYNDRNGVIHYYKRGGANTFPPPGIDKTEYTFKADGTGTFKDQGGTVYQTEWEFLSPAQTEMEVTFHLGTTVQYVWSLLSISDNEIIQSTYAPNENLFGSARLIPKP